MKLLYLILFLVIPFILFSQKNQNKKYDDLKSQIEVVEVKCRIIDSLKIELSVLNRKFEDLAKLNKQSFNSISNQLGVDSLKTKLSELNRKYKEQEKINEQSFNSISNQLSAASYSITIFGILFAIAAIVIGLYVTNVEKKIVKIREDTKLLLEESIIVKDDVVATNKLIQKDINGLFLKIKREETEYLLNRLLKIPRDISNVSNELLSRELERDDFKTLRKAYLSLKEDKFTKQKGVVLGLGYQENYKLLFFQHFLDLAIKDESIGPELINFYPYAISCSFENDILKSTKDFIKAIVDLGYHTRSNEITSFFNGLSTSIYQDFENIYTILFSGLKTRDDKFKFFNHIPDSKKCRVGKKNFGELLIKEYGEKELTESENIVFDRIKEIDEELKDEEKKRIEAEENQKKTEEERKRQIEVRKQKAEERKKSGNNNSTQQ